MWMGGEGCTLAESLVELIHQLEATYPSQGWQNSPDTGTIGDPAHQSQGSASDHNPWLNNTVRALDVANSDPNGPDCETLFQMVNRMYAAQDPRVYPNGYAIYRGRITDWNNPGGFHAQQGDQHLNHVHISVSQNPAGYNSTAPWPLTGGVSPDAGNIRQLPSEDDDMFVLFAYANTIWVAPQSLQFKRTFSSPASLEAWQKSAAANGAKVTVWQNVDPNQAKSIPTGASIA